MSTHPWDWVIHCILCMIPVIFLSPLWAVVLVVLFVIGLVEYEQKTQIWYDSLPWRAYIRYHAFYDILAGWIGILLGIYIRSLL